MANDLSIISSSNNALWCWRETADKMELHEPEEVLGNPADCLIRFEEYESDALENAFQAGQQRISFDSLTIDFPEMKLIGEGSAEWDLVRILPVASLPVSQPTMSISNPDSNMDTPETAPWYTQTTVPVAAGPRDGAATLPQLTTDAKSTGPWQSVPASQAAPPIDTLIPLAEAICIDVSSDQMADNLNAVKWCWRETDGQMYRHSVASIVGDRSDCWVLYDDTASSVLERAFLNGSDTCSPSPGYVVDFATMIQRKAATGFEREVRRLDGSNAASSDVPTKNVTYTTPNVTWCWEETPYRMSCHAADQIVGNPNDCWIRYDQRSNNELEAAYQSQKSSGDYSPMPGYLVNFSSMQQTKIATGFIRKIQRLDLQSADPKLSPSKKVLVHCCPYCQGRTKYPETMKTPFIYCNRCHSASARLVLYQSINSKWRVCRGCGFYAEISNFTREKRYYSREGEGRSLEEIVDWSVSSCCRRCAKEVLYPGGLRWFGGFAIPTLGSAGEPYKVSHANGIVSKTLCKKKLGKGDEKALRKAEAIYQSSLQAREHSPDLNFSVYLCRLLRNEYDGAESALRNALKECGNYQPARGALETLMEKRLKASSYPSIIQSLETEYKCLMANCLGRVVCPPSGRKICKRSKIKFQRKCQKLQSKHGLYQVGPFAHLFL